MPTITTLPASLTAGDSYEITLARADYAAPTWLLTYTVAGPSAVTWTSAAIGTSHGITLSAISTAALEAGDYWYSLKAVSGDLVKTLETGAVRVFADLSTMPPGGNVSYWQTLKTAAESALQALMDGGGVQMAMVLGRQMMFRSPKECLAVIATCDQRLGALRRRSAFGRVPVEFVR